MKRFLALFLCALILCTVSLAFAEDDFPYEWSQGATPNDNHFGYVRFEYDNKTHEEVQRLNNYTEDVYREVNIGDEVELVVIKPLGDDLEGLTYSWSMTTYDVDGNEVSKVFDYDTDTITTDPIPKAQSLFYICTVTDKFGNTAECYFDFRVLLYTIDPEEAEYVKGSGKDLVFNVKSIEGNDGLLDKVKNVEFVYFTEEYDEEFEDTIYEPNFVDISLDHVSETENGLSVTVPAEFLDEYEASDEDEYILRVVLNDSYVFARIHITEPIADTDDVTDTALYAVIAVSSLAAIVAVVIGKKKLSVR